MRLILTNLLLTLFAGILFAQSTDTVYVPATTQGGDPYIDSIIEFVVADTNQAGEQQHIYYKLDRGKFYILNNAINLKNPVHLVADPPVADDPDNTPPKILSNINQDGGTSTGSLIVTWADITLKNIWLGGTDLGGTNHGWGLCGALLVNDSMVTVNLDGIWCDFNSWSAFGSSMPHTNWYVNNFHARNEQNAGDQWTTFLFYLEGSTVIDTFVAKNTSYFQSNSCFLFPPAVVKYLEIDHCTFVNSFKWPFHQTQWLNAKFTNNIFYNSGALGLTETEAESQDPDGLMFGLVNADTLFANAVDSIAPGPYTIPENERMIEVKNNLWYYSSELEAYYAAHDTVWHPVFFNDRTQAMFDNDTDWPGLVAENNWNQDPMFNDFADLSVATGRLATACTDIRAGSTHGWDWDGDEDQELFRLLIQYPTTENFASYSGLTGTDGNPLGDLTQYDPSMVGIDDVINTPMDFVLKQNYPNPFNPTTRIAFNLNRNSDVTLTVFNVLGEKVKTLVNGKKGMGSHEVIWDGTNDTGAQVTSGVYFYKMETGSSSVTKKMIMLK